MHGDQRVFLALDAGKDGHHAVAPAPDSERLHDAALVNTEAGPRQVFDKLARHGSVLVVVGQPASIGAPAGSRPPEPGATKWAYHAAAGRCRR